MKKRFYLFFAFICLTGTIAVVGQQGNWMVRLTLPQEEYLPGEPITGLTIEIENVGPNPSPFPGFKGNLFLDEAKVPCKWKGLFVDTIPADPNSHVPKSVPQNEPVGAIHRDTWALNIADYCGLSDQMSNFYGVHILTYKYSETSGVKISQGSVQFTIIKPDATDKEAYDYFRGKPMSKPSDLLQKYPTSTYAGYAIINYPIELQSQSFRSALSEPEEYMRKWYDRGGGEESVQKRIKEAKEQMNKYIEYAEGFLKAHPDFHLNGLIRRKYIMCLGFTGRKEEALKQMEILSKGEGKEAQEAKKFIDELKGLQERVNTETVKEPKTDSR